MLRPCIPSLCGRCSATVPHQICEFHVIKELTKAILRAVAKVRKKLAAQKPAGSVAARHAQRPNELRASGSGCNRKSQISSSIVIFSCSTI